MNQKQVKKSVCYENLNIDLILSKIIFVLFFHLLKKTKWNIYVKIWKPKQISDYLNFRRKNNQINDNLNDWLTDWLVDWILDCLGREPSPLESSLCGAASGGFAAALTTPLVIILIYYDFKDEVFFNMEDTSIHSGQFSTWWTIFNITDTFQHGLKCSKWRTFFNMADIFHYGGKFIIWWTYFDMADIFKQWKFSTWRTFFQKTDIFPHGGKVGGHSGKCPYLILIICLLHRMLLKQGLCWHLLDQRRHL